MNNNNNKNDNDNDNLLKCNDSNFGRYIYSIFHLLMTLVAIYLAVRCNGLNFINLLIAFICPYIYIIYNIIQYNGICNKYTD